MQDSIVLQRFRQFREIYVSSNVPNSLLLELMESFLTSDDEPAAEEIPVPVLDGQLSLLDVAA